MLEFLQATAATDTLGWAAGVGAAFTFVIGCVYAPALPLLPIVIVINLVRQAMGLRSLGVD
jgi:hypothetical protein